MTAIRGRPQAQSAQAKGAKAKGAQESRSDTTGFGSYGEYVRVAD